MAEEEGIQLDSFISFEDADTTQLHSGEYILGGLFILGEFLRNNPEIVKQLVNIVHEHYSRVAFGSDVEFTLHVEDDDGVRSIRYSGPVGELDEILDELERLE